MACLYPELSFVYKRSHLCLRTLVWDLKGLDTLSRFSAKGDTCRTSYFF